MSAPLAHVGSGTYEPLQLLFLLAAGVGYYARARTLGRQGRPVPLGRQLSFGAGLALVFVSLASPVAHLGEELLLAHMAQHLVMADVGALLIVTGLTGPILQPLLGLRPLDRLRALAHPAVAFPLWAANLYVWHLPVLYEGALENELVHAIEHGAFLAFGINMWMSLFGPLPMPAWFGNGAKLVYIILVRLAGAALANVFIWSEKVFYPDYAPGEAEWGVSALNDQSVAGAIMMIEGSVLTILLFGWLFLKAAREGEERQLLLELAERRGVPLSEERAARAVGAGRGAELRRRLEEEAEQPSRPAASAPEPSEGDPAGTR
jgi:putative membrane protein